MSGRPQPFSGRRGHSDFPSLNVFSIKSLVQLLFYDPKRLAYY